MAELPEVETVTQSVKKHIMGKCFSSLDVNWKKVLDNFTFYDFQTSVKGRVVKNVYRRAKYIIIDFEPGILAIHLRMTGKLYLSQRSNLEKKHVSLCMKIDDNFLIFEDVRKFGRFYLYKDMNILNKKLGVEPLDEGFSEKWILKNMKSKKRQIKSLLLDQSFVCGIGNIYADEALWYAEIHPLSISNQVPKRKVLKLREGIIKVLSKSIEHGGTTIRDYTYDFSYVGNYALELNVFGKQGLPCVRCKARIIKTKVAQRGTHYCPKCQKV